MRAPGFLVQYSVSTKSHSLDPVERLGSRALILGSMPGERSLAVRQYYANPNNHFWFIMDELFGAGPGLSYQQRLARLRSAGVALWDVLESAEREGSADAAIVAASARPNNFRAFLASHKTLRCIFFNGEAAEKWFHKLVVPDLGADVSRLLLKRLPSTSPTNARLSREAKLREWKIIKRSL